MVTAPSGTGKTTLLKNLMAADPHLRFSISYTTRTPRPGEVSGKDYFFVSPEEFRRLLPGFTEQSNVSVVEEMVNMIISQRAYEASSKVIQTADSMFSQANNVVR